MKFTIIAVSVPALRQVLSFQNNYREKYPEDSLDFSCFYIAGMEQKYLLHPEILIESIRQADVAIIDTMGASEALQEIVREGLVDCKGHRIVIGNTLREYLRLGSFSMGALSGMMKKPDSKKPDSKKPDSKKTEEMAERKKQEQGSALDKMHRMRRMALMLGNVIPFGITKDMKNVFRLIDYWQQATQEDIESFLYLLLRQYGGRKYLPKEKPCTMRYGIYLKDPFTLTCEDNLAKFRKKTGRTSADKKKDTVAVLFYGHSYPNDFLPVVKAIVRELEATYHVLPIAFSQNEDADQEKLKSYLCQKEFPVRAVINLMPFRLGAGPMGGNADGAVEILKELDVPYLKPFCLTKVSEKEWEDADAVNPGEFLISILLPELDGGIATFPIGVMEETEQGDDGLTLPQLTAIPERIQALKDRLDRLICLSKKKKEEKKLAIIFYNYPPGESNVFGGSFLDTFVCAEKLLQSLKDAGYLVHEMTAQQLRNAFVEEGRCNFPQWCEEEDAKLTYRMDGEVYPIKGIQNGNVFLGLQPLRQDYHDRNQEPPKAYQAFYRWIREEFGADALIHFGTHGTLEFLPGKDNGMTGSCWPDRLIGDLPHFYYYYIGNPSEAMLAKRRSLATLISYQAPPLKKSGLFGEWQEVKEMIAEYRESLQSAPERSRDILNNIGKLSASCGLTGAETEMRAGDLDALEERLYEYENSLITDGLHVINEEETEGLFHALEGGYLPVGTAGDVIKNPDILPSGRNLVQFDPRLVPTRTACERGEKAARLALEKYRAENGTWPDTTAVILWGLETSRSQGETIGQILYYLGLRLKTEKGSYDDRLEIIPMEELGRPRIDVIIHICGFFRDMYPNLIDNLNEMLQRLLRQGESDEENYFAGNTKKLAKALMADGKKNALPDEKTAWELASCRIFGPKEGEYGTRLTETVRSGKWKEAAELGASFTEDLSYGYTFRQRGTNAKQVLELQYPHVDLISQVRNNIEYELTDLDHYYEFYGGLSKAIEQRRGDKPVMLVADTTGEQVKVQEIQEALQRGITTRLLNPAWIEGMMRHEYHGVQQIEKRFENVMGFAASTDAVDSQTFSRLTRCYAGNETLRHQMQRSNKWAYMKMMERLMEAENRGYYQATEEELTQIREAYLEAEGEAEE